MEKAEGLACELVFVNGGLSGSTRPASESRGGLWGRVVLAFAHFLSLLSLSRHSGAAGQPGNRCRAQAAARGVLLQCHDFYGRSIPDEHRGIAPGWDQRAGGRVSLQARQRIPEIVSR